MKVDFGSLKRNMQIECVLNSVVCNIQNSHDRRDMTRLVTRRDETCYRKLAPSLALYSRVAFVHLPSHRTKNPDNLYYHPSPPGKTSPSYGNLKINNNKP